MAQEPLSDDQCLRVMQAVAENGSKAAAARALGIPETTLRSQYEVAERRGMDGMTASSMSRLSEAGYSLSSPDMTPKDAWDAHASVTDRKLSAAMRSRWQKIKRKERGPFVLFHCTDQHIDDDGAMLKLLEQDITASHQLNAIMCHGGDLLNNWPLAGKLAKKWADQECTMAQALLRAQHFISIFKPDAWVDGNHEEMNPYLADLFTQWLPAKVIRDYWSVAFVVETPGVRDCRVRMSHKFTKGSSWFHKAHGHIREMLEGEECDLLIDGHVHSDGVLDHTLPERAHAGLCVASAGYKSCDSFGKRISKSNGLPKLRGRAHWIVCDTQAEMDANFLTAFKCPRQAEAMMNGLQNLRAI